MLSGCSTPCGASSLLWCVPRDRVETHARRNRLAADLSLRPCLFASIAARLVCADAALRPTQSGHFPLLGNPTLLTNPTLSVSVSVHFFQDSPADSVRMPFNPVLGETFRGVQPAFASAAAAAAAGGDGGAGGGTATSSSAPPLHVLVEQVSHHPPVTAVGLWDPVSRAAAAGWAEVSPKCEFFSSPRFLLDSACVAAAAHALTQRSHHAS